MAKPNFAGALGIAHRVICGLTRSVLVGVVLWSGPAQARFDLSVPPQGLQHRPGPSVSLGSVGLDPCPGGYCRTPPHGNLFYFMTKGTHPIEPVPGILLHIPLGGGGG
ncbi:MAG TPA: hypothetical protein VLI93_09335 [Acetobacteraceae bacterium]|nr:hypothetical protein [Acetobacteraceae bacterium]